jgi:hypothetical protein
MAQGFTRPIELPLAVTQGGTGVTTSTGTGSVVLNTSPTLVTPVLGAATATSLEVGDINLSTNTISSDTANDLVLSPANGQALDINITGGGGYDATITGAGNYAINLGSGLFVLDGTTGIDAVLDEDNMASDSATSLATQQSIKAYVDAQVGGAGFQWNDVAGTSQSASVNNGYVISNASQTTVSLPATAAVGSVISVQGKGAAGWILGANTGQVINYGSSPTSATGSLTSTNQFDAVTVVCITANSVWGVSQSIGTLTVA